ncbi:MAG: hypothetical protein AAB427_09100 [Chloroflexota bacterium]
MTKPEFLKVGALVKVQHWIGEIVDLSVTENGKIMVLISSPKGIWRNHPAEWLEYQPEQITPATQDEIARDLEIYEARIADMLKSLDSIKTRWRTRTTT